MGDAAPLARPVMSALWLLLLALLVSLDPARCRVQQSFSRHPTRIEPTAKAHPKCNEPVSKRGPTAGGAYRKDPHFHHSG